LIFRFGLINLSYSASHLLMLLLLGGLRKELVFRNRHLDEAIFLLRHRLKSTLLTSMHLKRHIIL